MSLAMRCVLASAFMLGFLWSVVTTENWNAINFVLVFVVVPTVAATLLILAATAPEKEKS